ncbi:MAG: hypothetical protein CMC14_07805 [Flavobacteriaceae bacterium]|nr:hypothetical protein [Flavobacteriaceae bacterium]|tara:strand:+ start:62923 stop:67821 length:4899 start_codon:yes stop_codon:yes gene_type:complete
MKKFILFSLVAFFCHSLFSQVGIGNTDPKSTLDIRATNIATPSNTDGILIPRVDEFPATNPTVDQDGMMVFATGNGTPNKGFYYWDNGSTSWIAISSGGGSDDDWYEENTTSPPTSNSADIFTDGNVGIGLSNVLYPLQIETPNGSRTVSLLNENTGSSVYGIYNNINESVAAASGSANGIVNSITRSNQSSISGVSNSFQNSTVNAGFAYLFGYQNSFGTSTSNTTFALINRFQGTTGTAYGTSNLIGGPITNFYGVDNHNIAGANLSGTFFGLYNSLTGSDSGDRYGVYTSFAETGSGDKYGEYITIATSAGGTHYGVYSDVQNGTGYAGYFLGRTSLGNGTTNRYLMPASDGTSGQVMTTDGAGNISFTTPSSGGGTLDQAYDFGGAGAGRTITADNGAVIIEGNGGLRVESTNETNMLRVDGANDAVGIGENNPVSPLQIGITTPFDLAVANSGQDGIFIKGGNSGGLNQIGGSIGFGGASTTRSDGRRAAIASIQSGVDEDNIGLGFYIHNGPINTEPMVEGMRLKHNGNLGINNNDPSATLDVVGTLQFVDGNQAAGYVLSSDANGNASWTDPTTLFTDTDWIVTGNDQYAANTGNVGIGDTTPDYKLDLEYAGTLDRAFNIDFQNTAGTGIAQGLNVTAQSNSTGFVWGANVELINTNSSSESIGIRSTNTSGANDKYGVTGSAIGAGSLNTGISGRATGATTNQGGYFTADGSGGTTNYGIIATAQGATTNFGGAFYSTLGGTSANYGIIAVADNASGTNWAGFFGDTSPGSGNVFVNDNLRVDGQLSIDPTGTGYTFPTADGTAGQVLTTDGFGNVSFTTISNTDDQTINTFSFNSGTNIVSLEIEDDGVPVQTIDLSSLEDEDADWLTTVGSNVPASNTDDIYTQGNVSIGSTTNIGNLNVIHNEAPDGTIDYVQYNEVSNSGNDDKTIIYNLFGGAQAGDNTAIHNILAGNGSGTYRGMHNYSYATVTGDIYGMYNTFAATGGGNHYGSRNLLSGTGIGAKYGTYNLIASTAGGAHYGVYSDVQKSGTYAGYFIGRMSLGNSTTNRYIMPGADGTNGQVIQTDGAGNLSWTTSSGEATTASNGLTETGNDVQLGGILTQNTTINNSNFDLEISSTGSATEGLSITKADNAASSNIALDIIKTTNGTGFGTGVNVSMNGTGNGALYTYSASITNTGSGTKIAYNNVFSGSGTGTLYANRNQFLGTGSGSKYGVHNTFGTSVTSAKFGVYNDFDSSSGNYYGMNNNMVGATNSAVFGVNNTLSGTGTGAKTGVSNSFSGANGNANIYIGMDNSFNDTGNGDRWGVRTNLDGTGTGNQYGIFNDLTGTGSGTKYGSYNYIDASAGGTHYGVYSEVDNTNGYAGYFLGQNYVSDAIGINNPAPDGRLDIIHNSTGATSPHIMLTAQNANAGTRIVFDNAVETTNNWVLFARADDAVNGGTFNIYSSEAGTNVVRLDSDGKMGVMRNPATNTLEVEGDASKSTAGSWLANSDQRLKKEIKSISGETALDKIEKMRGVTYLWNDDKTGTKRPEGLQYGFIAQELMEVFPEKVTKDNLGFYQTAYGDYDPIFVEAIKELKTEVDTLKDENQKLKEQLSKMEKIEARLSALEAYNSSNNTSEKISEKKK